MLLRTLPGSIEQLPLDFFSVSCDLNRGETVVHRRGPLADAVGASISLPGVVPPLPRDGRLLVDGGVLNNLPVDVMAAAGEGPIIASDVTNRRGAVAGDTLTIGETLMRTLTLASIDTAVAAQRYADVVIEPVDLGVGFLEFHQIDRLREAGRRAAREALAVAPAHILG
jgi:NTE family protein